MAKKNKAAREAFARMGKEGHGIVYLREFPCIDPLWEPEKKRLTADEMLMTTWMTVMAKAMQSGLADIMRDRLSMLPNGWNRFRRATGALLHLCDDMLCTLIPGQLYTLNETNDRGMISITVKKATGIPNMGSYVMSEELQTIANAAQNGECAICMKEGGEIRSCPLRKAFDACGLCTQQYDEDCSCLYRRGKIDVLNGGKRFIPE